MLLRKQVEVLAREWDLVPRLRAHVAESNPCSMFRPGEVQQLRSMLLSFLQEAGFRRALPCQQFLLDLWAALVQLTGDVDECLPGILERRAFLSGLPASGVWDVWGPNVADEAETELVVRMHGSAGFSLTGSWDNERILG